jgi:hypothetical protein
LCGLANAIKNCLEQFLTSRSDGPKGGCHGWQAIKKKTPRLRGFCRLFADILDLLAILAAVPRVPVAKVRFLRDVLG